MSDVGEIASAIQAFVVLFVLGILLNSFISTLPEDFVVGPFADTLAFLANLPWILVLLGILVLLSMLAEVVDG